MAASPLARSQVVNAQRVPGPISSASKYVDHPLFNQSLCPNSPQDSVHKNYFHGVYHTLDPSILRTTTANAYLRWADSTVDTSLRGGRSSFNYPQYQSLHDENNDHLDYLSIIPCDRYSGWESDQEAYGSSHPHHMSQNVWP